MAIAEERLHVALARRRELRAQHQRTVPKSSRGLLNRVSEASRTSAQTAITHLRSSSTQCTSDYSVVRRADVITAAVRTPRKL